MKLICIKEEKKFYNKTPKLYEIYEGDLYLICDEYYWKIKIKDLIMHLVN